MSSTSLPHMVESASQYSPPVDRNDPDLLSSQRAVLKRLKAWHKWEQDRQRSLVDCLLRSSPAIIPRPALPSDEELLSLAQYYFPLRDDLEVTVCDYHRLGDGPCIAEPHVTTLKYLDQCTYSSQFKGIRRHPEGVEWDVCDSTSRSLLLRIKANNEDL